MQRTKFILALGLSALAAQGQQPTVDDVDAIVARIAEQRSKFDTGADPPVGHFLILQQFLARNYVLYPEGVSDRRYILVVRHQGGGVNEKGERSELRMQAFLGRQDLIAGKTRHTWAVRMPYAPAVTEVPFEGGTLAKYLAFLGVRYDEASLPSEVLSTLNSTKGFAGYQYHFHWRGYKYFYINPSGSPATASFEYFLDYFDETMKIPAINQPYRLPDQEIEFIRRQLGRTINGQ